jgi:hypothetical protein
VSRSAKQSSTTTPYPPRAADAASARPVTAAMRNGWCATVMSEHTSAPTLVHAAGHQQTFIGPSLDLQEATGMVSAFAAARAMT